MAEETSPIDLEPKTLQAGLEEPRASLVEQLETLEEGIKDTWHGATAVATRAVEGVKAAAETTVHAVQGAAETTAHAVQGAVETTAHAVQGAAETTAHAVQGAAHSTSDAMGWAFDLPAHVRRHPWLMVGAAMLLGVTVGSVIGRLRR